MNGIAAMADLWEKHSLSKIFEYVIIVVVFKESFAIA